MAVDIGQDIILLVEIESMFVPVHPLSVFGPHVFFQGQIWVVGLVLAGLKEILLNDQVCESRGTDFFPTCGDPLK